MNLTPTNLSKTPLRKVERSDLKRLVADLLAQGQADEVVDLLLTLLDRLWDDNELKSRRLAQLLKEKFGSKNERLDSTQLKLFLDEQLGSPQGEGPESPESPLTPVPPIPPIPQPEPKPGRERRGRNPLPANLPREKQRLEPKESERLCARCQAEKRCIGCETSELLEWVSGHFKVIEIERVKLACDVCEAGVVIAPVADKPIEQGRPGPGLLAHLVVGVPSIKKRTRDLPLLSAAQVAGPKAAAGSKERGVPTDSIARAVVGGGT